MKDDVRDAIHALTPMVKALAKLVDNAEELEVGDEHLDAMTKNIKTVQKDFEKISKAVEAARRHEQEVLIKVNEAKKAAKDAIDAANKELTDMRSLAKIEMDKATKKAKDDYDQYVRDLSVRKGQAFEELQQLEALIEQRKKDHKTIEDSLKSIRKRIDA